MVAALSDLLGERQYVSQYGTDAIGLVVHKAGVPADADGPVNVAMMSLDYTSTPPAGTLVFQRQATHKAPGTYETALRSQETANPGLWKVVWTYTLEGVAQTYVGIVEVGQASQVYDNLSGGMKAVVESAWVRFADLFDSPYGGPHLQVYFQTRFGRGRMAQLLTIAMQRLNNAAQPHTTYLVGMGDTFPFDQWGGLLDQALYIEAVKHLRRSYVEQPLLEGGTVARMDRRDYMDRWGAILQEEEESFRPVYENFKIAHMGFGRPVVLVSGGAYGNYGPTRFVGAAARPHYWTQWY